MLSRLQLGDKVLITFGGGVPDEFDDTLSFKPPFGPYPKELKETFPIGQSEIPEWDDAMVTSGCRGIKFLAESHPDSRFVVSCPARWKHVISQLLGSIEVHYDEI
jgi:7-cyano-7-deazaguanine tRNA-ribosyltransferase